MRVLIFTKTDESYLSERNLEDFEKNLKVSDYDVQKYFIDSVEGGHKAQLYDIYLVPSVVVTTDDGHYIQCWRGSMPMVADVKNYLSI